MDENNVAYMAGWVIGILCLAFGLLIHNFSAEAWEERKRLKRAEEAPIIIRERCAIWGCRRPGARNQRSMCGAHNAEYEEEK